jgi:hypothetical protein
MVLFAFGFKVDDLTPAPLQPETMAKTIDMTAGEGRYL